MTIKACSQQHRTRLNRYSNSELNRSSRTAARKLASSVFQYAVNTSEGESLQYPSGDYLSGEESQRKTKAHLFHEHNAAVQNKPLLLFFFTPVLNSQGMKKLRYAVQKSTSITFFTLGSVYDPEGTKIRSITKYYKISRNGLPPRNIL